MTKWNGQPAIGVIVAKIVELHARAVRVETKKRQDLAAKILKLASKP